MVDYGGLAVLVIGGYILIKYGPQIAAGLQQQQAAGGGTAPGAADGTTAGTAPTADTTTAPAATTPAPAPNITINMPAPTPTATQQLFPSLTFPAGTKIECVNNTQDPACGFKGHPKCCPGQTLLGTPLQSIAGKGPAVSTRAPKAAPPKRTGTLNPQCEGNPCGVTIPGKCLQSSTGNEVTCTQNTKTAGVAYSYMTQVVNGQRRTTIDPFFPAGFYLSQANYRSSLREPALH